MIPGIKKLKRQKPLEVNAWNFDEYILTSDLPALVCFGANYQKDSLFLYNALEWYAQRFDGMMIVAYANIDVVTPLFGRCNVTEYPTLIIFEDGKEFSRMVGYDYHGDIDDLLYNFFGYLPYDRTAKFM